MNETAVFPAVAGREEVTIWDGCPVRQSIDVLGGHRQVHVRPPRKKLPATVPGHHSDRTLETWWRQQHGKRMSVQDPRG